MPNDFCKHSFLWGLITELKSTSILCVPSFTLWLVKKKKAKLITCLLNEKLKLLIEMIFVACPWISATHAISAFLYHRKLRVDCNYFTQYTFKNVFQCCSGMKNISLGRKKSSFWLFSKKRHMTKYCCTSLWKKQSIDKKVICSFWRWNIISTFGSCYNRKQVAQMHEDDIGTTLDSLPLKTPCPLVVFLVMFPKYKQNQLVNIKIY